MWTDRDGKAHVGRRGLDLKIVKQGKQSGVGSMIEDQEADINGMCHALQYDIDAMGMPARDSPRLVKHNLATGRKPMRSPEPGNSGADNCNPWSRAAPMQDHAAARGPVLSCSIRA